MSKSLTGLTAKQKKVVLIIEAYIKSKGIPPTVREIGELLGEKTPGAVQGILNRLQQKGVIKRQAGMARSIQIVTEDLLYSDSVHIPKLKRINQRNLDDLINIYNISKYHSISSDLIDSEKDCFMFEHPGIKIENQDTPESMEILFIDMAAKINKGDHVLAQYKNHTLCREFHSSDEQGIILLKENDFILDKENFNEDEIKIIGKVTAVFTKYK